MPVVSRWTDSPTMTARLLVIAVTLTLAASGCQSEAGGDAPGQPLHLMTMAGNESVTVSWTAPFDIGSSAILNYTVTTTPGGGTVNTGGETSAIVKGLKNGTSYRFAVFATNAFGNGPLSALSDPTMPIAIPGAPTQVVATPGDARAMVSWMAPANTNGNAAASYTVTSSPDGIRAIVSDTTATIVGSTLR